MNGWFRTLRIVRKNFKRAAKRVLTPYPRVLSIQDDQAFGEILRRNPGIAPGSNGAGTTPSAERQISQPFGRWLARRIFLLCHRSVERARPSHFQCLPTAA